MTSYSDSITAAVRDGEDLVGWAEPNVAVLADERTEAALLAALSGPVADELAMGVPLLRFGIEQGVEAVPLIYGMVSNFAGTHRSLKCDRCRGNGVVLRPQLVVPMGGSAVVLSVCAGCRHHLDASFPGLIWNA
jgi:hypothetical protein